MPADDGQVLDADALFGALRNLCSNYVAADLSLLSGSLKELSAPNLSGIPVLRTAPCMAARLTFDFGINEDRSFLFGLIRRERSERLAELDVKLEVAPSRNLVPGAAHAVSIYGVWPPFIQAVAPDRSMTVLLENGQKFKLHMPGNGRPDQATVTALDPGSFPVAFNRLQPQLMVSMLMTLAQWVRSGGATPPAPARHKTGETLDRLLSRLVSGVNQLLLDTAQVFLPTGAEGARKLEDRSLARRIAQDRSHVAGLLGADSTAYGFAYLSCRLKLLLNENGELPDKPFEGNNQRYDVEARLDTGVRPPRLVVALKVPDLLVSGDLYDQFLEALMQPSNLADLLTPIQQRLLPTEAPSIDDLKSFVSSARTSKIAIIARITRTASGEDTDLVLLRGTLAERKSLLLLRMKVLIDDRTDTDPSQSVGKIKDIDLIAAQFGELKLTFTNVSLEDTRTYFYRAFNSLLKWRQRFATHGEAQ